VSQTSTQAVRGGSVIGQSPGSAKLMMTLGLEVSLLDRFRFPTGNNLLIVMSLTVHRACTYKADGQGMGEFTPYTSGLFTVRIYGKLCYGSGGYCVEFRPGGADHSITSELNWGINIRWSQSGFRNYGTFSSLKVDHCFSFFLPTIAPNGLKLAIGRPDRRHHLPTQNCVHPGLIALAAGFEPCQYISV